MERKKRRTSLSYTEGSSDKVYDVSLIPSVLGPNEWTVVATYGKRYSVNNKNIIVQGVSYDQANHFFEKTVKSKLRKGYEISFEE